MIHIYYVVIMIALMMILHKLDLILNEVKRKDSKKKCKLNLHQPFCSHSSSCKGCQFNINE